MADSTDEIASRVVCLTFGLRGSYLQQQGVWMPDPIDNEIATALELVLYARPLGVDLEPLRNEGAFQTHQRWIFLWRAGDGLPSSSHANAKAGMLHYNLQGAIAVLPNRLKGSDSSFRGVWTEAGTFADIEQAFELVKAWLLDRKEVDDLPERRIGRYGI